MNALQAEKTEITEEDKNLAAVTEVEAGIRDFVRKDVAYLRRTPATPSTDAPADTSAEAAVSSVNTLIHHKSLTPKLLRVVIFISQQMSKNCVTSTSLS